VGELDTRNADLKRADDERLKLLSVVTHELGNPLTSISAFASLLSRNKDKNLSAKQISMLNSIKGSEERMRTLLRDLQDLSMVESGAMRLEYSSVDLKDMVAEVVQSMEPIVLNRGQSIELHNVENESELSVDRVRISQVLTNLISNASKYSPENSAIVVDASFVGESVSFAVTDNGIGISDEDQDKLFTPFFRADNYETREMPGTGLGLVICKQIAELHGGELSLQSARGAGSTFTLTIPTQKEISASESAA
jgi:signal transduction histidine kinase